MNDDENHDNTTQAGRRHRVALVLFWLAGICAALALVGWLSGVAS